MAGDDDDKFDPKDVELFSSLDEDETKKIERFLKWRDWEGRKAQKTNQNSSLSGQNRDLTLREMRELMADQPTRSILKSLLAEAETFAQSDPNGKKAPGGNQNPQPKKSRLI